MGKQDKILAKRKAVEPNPRLDDILNRQNLDRHLGTGIVKCATHPTLPLYLYDYSSLCERRAKWDGVTVVTRGLLRDNKGVVVARPLQKFFSWGGKSTSAVPAFRWTENWYGLEKMDGTMIVASNYNGELMLTTRASFDSWQIAEARKLWPKGVLPPVGETWILEYVGPDNRIVVEYPESRLVLLAAIDNWTGADRPTEAIQGFLRPKRYEADDVNQLLALENNDGSVEGFVTVIERKDKPSIRLKVKYASYNQRHLAILGKANP